MRLFTTLMCAVFLSCATVPQAADDASVSRAKAAYRVQTDGPIPAATQELKTADRSLTVTPNAAASPGDTQTPKRVVVDLPNQDWLAAPPALRAQTNCAFLMISDKLQTAICLNVIKGDLKETIKKIHGLSGQNKAIRNKPIQYSKDGRTAWFDQEFLKDGKVVRAGRLAIRELADNPGFPVVMQTNWDPEKEKAVLEDFTLVLVGLRVADDK